MALDYKQFVQGPLHRPHAEAVKRASKDPDFNRVVDLHRAWFSTEVKSYRNGDVRVSPLIVNNALVILDAHGRRVWGLDQFDGIAGCGRTAEGSFVTGLRWQFEPETVEDRKHLESTVPVQWKSRIKDPVQGRVEYYAMPSYFTTETMPWWLHGITFFDAHGQCIERIWAVDLDKSIAVTRDGQEIAFTKWSLYAVDAAHAKDLRRRLHPKHYHRIVGPLSRRVSEPR